MSTSITNPIRVCLKWEVGKLGAAFAGTLGKHQGGAGAGGVCVCLWGLCQSHVLLGEDRDAPTQGCPYAALLCPCSPGHCPRDSGGPLQMGHGDHEPWTLFPSPGGSASFPAPFELRKQEHRWHRTCPAQLCCHTQPLRPWECLCPPSLHRQWTLLKL